jgi:phosphatidate phosphatase APP1
LYRVHLCLSGAKFELTTTVVTCTIEEEQQNGEREKEQQTIMVNTNPTKNVLRKCKQFFSTSVTIRVTLVKDPVVSHETEMDGIVITHVTYPFYSNGNDDVEAQMNKNNELLLRGYSSAASHAESHVMNAVVNLQQGDHIYIRHRESKAQHVRGALHSSFSGFQII